MHRILPLAIILWTLVLLPSILFSQEKDGNFSREFSYHGSKLEGDVFLCKSDKVVAAGYLNDMIREEVTEIVDVSKQKNDTTWRITLKGQTAEVVAFTGATQTLEAAETFSYHNDESGQYLTLSQVDRGAQVITIDRANSTFVYSGQSISVMMNKTNIFIGSCRSYF